MTEPTSDPDHIMQNRIEQLAGWLAEQYGFKRVTEEIRTQVGSVLEAIEAQGWVIGVPIRHNPVEPIRHEDRVSPLTMVGRPPKSPTPNASGYLADGGRW